MRKVLILFLTSCLLFFQCSRKQEKSLYTIGIFQVFESPTLNEVRKGFIQALEDNGLRNSESIKYEFRNGQGDISEVQKIAQEFVKNKIDLIIALSTPCLQAALIETQSIPIIFSSVANPYLVGAGKTVDNHLSNITGVASTAPIRESLAFMKKILPNIKRIGTLWTPSEINSEYYLEIAREGANEQGLEILTVPVTNTSEVLLSAQVLINKKIDAIFQISDNTINASFEVLGKIAEENSIPLFGGFLLSTQLGACAAMGYDFFDMGYKTGQLALKIKNGESPAQIPFQSMTKVKLHLNLAAAEKQKVQFPPEILKIADEILDLSGSPQNK